MHYEPKDPNFEARVRASFARQGVMKTLGIEIARLAPGELDLTMAYNPAFSQQHGFLHAGVITTALDSACGYAAHTLMVADAEVLTIELKANFLAPAKGERFEVRAAVLKAGRTITVAEGRAFAITEGQPEKLVASITVTLMSIVGRGD